MLPFINNRSIYNPFNREKFQFEIRNINQFARGIIISGYL